MSCYTISGKQVHRESSDDKTICGRYIAHVATKKEAAEGPFCKYCFRGPQK